MILHTVAFRLHHAAGSDDERNFLRQAAKLADIPGIHDFKLLRQTSKKNPYQFGLSMSFESESSYRDYNEHPQHVSFLESCWFPEVAEFMELDYEEINQ